MADDDKILVVDTAIKSRNNPDLNKKVNLQMLVLNKGGRECAEQDLDGFFKKRDCNCRQSFQQSRCFYQRRAKKLSDISSIKDYP